MARSSKGVIVLGATYRPAETDEPNGSAWRLDAMSAAEPANGEQHCTAFREGRYGLVHDLLDHWIPGFPPMGHRAEAKALVQHAARTGADPLPTLEALVDRDLLSGCCQGEPLAGLLPHDLAEFLPRKNLSDVECLRFLRQSVGDGLLRTRLITRLVEVGWDGMAPARATWIGRGLDFGRRRNVALALERLMAGMEEAVHSEGWSQAHGELAVASDMVRFRFDSPGVWEWAREVRPA